MKKSVTIVFLLVLTSSHTPLGQLFKLPVLVEHFVKHNKDNGISFWEFLYEHYSPDHNDADKQEDEQLPFKSTILRHIGFAIVANTTEADFTMAPGVPLKISILNFYSPQLHISSIFHPPRV